LSDPVQLLAAARAGDDQACSARAEHYRGFVRGRLRQAAHRRNWFWLDDLDDVCQEVLVRFCEAVRDGRFRFRDEAQLRGYLVRTAFFVVMHRKDDAAQERPLSDLLGDDERAQAVELFQLGGFAQAAFDTLGRRECLVELYRAIDGLAPARAEVLRLTLLGLKPREIAPRLGRSPGAVSVLKFHALEDLRAALEAGDFWANCGRYFVRE
jgi:RNA polymerase sigma factor (sigma-70 family)